jgi:hypothetical protein
MTRSSRTLFATQPTELRYDNHLLINDGADLEQQLKIYSGASRKGGSGRFRYEDDVE